MTDLAEAMASYYGMPDMDEWAAPYVEPSPDTLTVQVTRWKNSQTPWGTEVGVMECDASMAVTTVDVALADPFTCRILITLPKPDL